MEHGEHFVPIVRGEKVLPQSSGDDLNIVVGTVDWYLWLSKVTSFTFSSESGRFTACKEHRHGERRYWKAFRKSSGKVRRVYLGKDEKITLECLNKAAETLAKDVVEIDAISSTEASRLKALAIRQEGVPDSHSLGVEVRRYEPRSLATIECPSPVATTKLHPPSTSCQLIDRPRLVAKLSAARLHRLTLISAAAGYGKTTLLSQWYRLHRGPVAWLTLDADDNLPNQFWFALCNAFAQAYPEFPPPSSLTRAASSHNGFLTEMIEAIARYREGIYLILDDYNLIDNPSIHAGLSFLIHRMPSNGHILIASRTSPPLHLSLLRARGCLLEVGTNELGFTLEETTALVNEQSEVPLTETEVEMLQEHSEGWVTALTLWVQAKLRQASQTGFNGPSMDGDRDVDDYLTDEVWRPQSQAMREFFLQTAILTRLCGPLCDDLLAIGEGRGQEILEQAERQNLFTFPFGSERRWFRYHQLFASCLRSKLQRTKPSSIRDLDHKASLWYAHNGFPTDSVCHALSSRDVSLAASLIERNASEILRQGRTPVVLEWFRSLPNEFICTRPRLCYYHAVALAGAGHFDAAEKRLQEAEHAFEVMSREDLPAADGHADLGGQDQIRATLMALRAAIAADRGHLEVAREIPPEAVAGCLPEADTLRARVLQIFASFHMIAGDPSLALRAMLEARGAVLESESYRIMTLSHLANMQAVQGQLQDAERTLRDALALGTARNNEPGLAHCGLYRSIAMVNYEWNNLEIAASYTTKALELARWTGITMYLLLGYKIHARILQANGDVPGALEILSRGEEIARRDDLQRYLSWLVEYRIRLYLRHGNVEAASDWVESCRLRLRNGFDQLSEAEHITLARALVHRSMPREAASLLERIWTSADLAGRTRSRIKILAMKSIALQAMGETDLALAELERALVIAEPGNFIRIFVDELGPMEALLSKLWKTRAHPRQAQNHRVSACYLTTLLKAFRPGTLAHKDEDISTVKAQCVELLSERELEVLRLVASGWERSRIARELIVSVNTVSSHIKSIYGKLGVHSPTEALYAAQTLNVWPKKSS